MTIKDKAVGLFNITETLGQGGSTVGHVSHACTNVDGSRMSGGAMTSIAFCPFSMTDNHCEVFMGLELNKYH